MTLTHPTSSIALIALFAATACTTVPTRERDGSTSDGGSSMDATPSDDVATQPEASNDTSVVADTGILPADSGVATDSGVIVDSGVVVDSGACRPPTRACAGRCVDTATDPAHCGTCGNACGGGANAVAECVASTCGLRCNTGFANCDSIASNGCESALNTAMNCGSCGTRCSGSTPMCDGATGRCVSTCPPGQTQCGTSCVDTNTSPLHCGGCGSPCATPANSTAVCASGTCSSVCVAGFANCDSLPANGCEVNTNTNTSHCGRCSNPCPARANATVTCAAGSCGFTCLSGFGDCDGNAANGCETSLTRDPANCGRCGVSCGPNGACINGSTTPTCISCANNSCGTYCATLATDTANCGACGYRCPAAPAPYTTTCTAGICRYGASCDNNRGDCNRNPGDGYEIDLDSSSTNCGACGNTCAIGSRCCNGACRLSSQSCFPCV
ncbi:MAG: hypothetical protein U0269_13530 [Polyangiales bacterium]